MEPSKPSISEALAALAAGAVAAGETAGISETGGRAARGRWASEVAERYQRALVRPQLEASSAVADIVDVDMEAVCRGWHQPAHF